MDKDEPFRKALKQTLDRQNIDRETQQALRAARSAALDAAPRTSRSRWVPAAAISSLVLVIVAVLLFRGFDEGALPQMPADDLAVISSEDELELLEEIEFYLWFDEEQNV